MIVRHFDVKTPETQPPDDEGWENNWPGFHGYYAMTKCISPERRAEEEDRDRIIRESGEMTLGEFQYDCLLSILMDIKKDHVNFVELGAGWGRLCLALAGAIDYRIMPFVPKIYRCLAVEAEPTHFEWTKQHFEIHNINGIVLHGAVSSKNGTCRFNADPDADACYGQAICDYKGSHKVLGIGKKLYNSIRNEFIKIPKYTIDHLLNAHDFHHADIIQMDVQGAEYEAVLGASESIKKDLIDYLLIGTHGRKLNDMLRDFLSRKFDLIVDIYPMSVGRVDGFAPIRMHDGIQLYKRRNM